MKPTTPATNDLERDASIKVKSLLNRKAKKTAPAESALKGWADSSIKSRNKS